MNKVFLTVACVLTSALTLMLTGCETPDMEDAKVGYEISAAEVTPAGTNAEQNSSAVKAVYNYNGEHLSILTDPETGVQYLMYSSFKSGGGITPRLNADGSLHTAEQDG